MDLKEINTNIKYLSELLQNEGWKDGCPIISPNNMIKLMGKNENSKFTRHKIIEKPLATEDLNVLTENFKYTIIRKYYKKEGKDKIINHTFLVVREDNKDKEIYDSWYFTNRKNYFEKCFDYRVEKEYNFLVNRYQQDENQGVCSVFALATYYSKLMHNIKNLDNLLKLIDPRIEVIKVTEEMINKVII